MASVASLREHLVSELNDLLNAEQQLIEALPQMEEKAASKQLKTAFRSHLTQTRNHERHTDPTIAGADEGFGNALDRRSCGHMASSSRKRCINSTLLAVSLNN